MFDGTGHIDGVPDDDAHDDQVERAGPIELLVIVSIVKLSLSMRKDGSGKGMFPFHFLQAQEYPTAKLRELQPIEHKQRALNHPHVVQCCSQVILTWVGA